MKDLSSYFWEVLIAATSARTECQHETIHYGDDNYDWEEGEFEELERLDQENPDEYQIHYGGPSSGYYNGKLFVYDCPECMKLADQLSDYLYDNRSIILDFLRKASNGLLFDHKQMQNVLDDIKGKE